MSIPIPISIGIGINFYLNLPWGSNEFLVNINYFYFFNAVSPKIN